MINNTTQLEGALGQIAWAADALEGLRRDVDEQNARVFPVIAEAYISHIRSITVEACAYVEGLRQEASPNSPTNGSNGFSSETDEPKRLTVEAA